jgi:hypothetical protein
MNLELKDITFCDTIVNNICSTSYKEFILSSINTKDPSILKTPIVKPISGDDFKTIDNKEHLLSVHSSGNTYYLYLFKDRHNVCTMIDHKKMKGYDYPRILIVPFRMDDSIYEGTLFRGELIKNNKNKWIFLVNDLLLYKNKSLVDSPFLYRIQKTYEILDKYYKSDPWIESCMIKIKCYYTYQEIDRFISHHVKNIDFGTTGIVCTSIDKYSYSIYIPFENKPIRMLETKKSTTLKHPVFGIRKTRQSGIYQLYCKKDGGIIKHSIARIPNLKINMFLQTLCKQYDENYNVTCTYDCNFDKWIPMLHTKENMSQFHEIVK